jgi:hypothetical protein
MPKLTRLKFVLATLIGLSIGGERVSVAGSAESLPEIAGLEVAGRASLFRPIEVRTRRLHLVRPDLLRYPIQYDTFC